MTAEELIAAFETLAEAPDGVARLRELVLQLAVRGKLVPQDPDDEPASVLLERIATEKARLVAEKRLRKQKVLPPVLDDDAPFGVPSSWKWARFGHTHFNRDAERVPLSREVRSARRGTFDYYGASGVIDHIDEYIFDATLLVVGEDGANLLLRSTPVAFIANGRYWVNNHAHVLDSVDEQSLRYLAIFVNATDLTPFVTGTAQPKLNQARLNRIPCPLPPLPEQHRIVARVDELMGLLDRLEAARTACNTTRASLRDSALDALQNADTAQDVEAAWRRIEERMEDLVCEPADIAPLRQTILQLAVRGRLVAQYPGDEPASVLLERIAAEKARLVAEGMIRKTKTLAPVNETDALFSLPPTWRWMRLRDACVVFCDSLHKTPTYVDGGEYYALRPRDASGGVLRLDSARRVDRATYDVHSRKHRVRKGDVIYSRELSLGWAVGAPSGDRCCLSQGMMVMRPTSLIDLRYFHCLLNGPVGRSQAIRDAVGAAHLHLNLRDIARFALPVPPLPEQQRIIARVDELMGLLDRLEERLAAAQTTQTAFAAAAVHHLDG